MSLVNLVRTKTNVSNLTLSTTGKTILIHDPSTEPKAQTNCFEETNIICGAQHLTKCRIISQSAHDLITFGKETQRLGIHERKVPNEKLIGAFTYSSWTTFSISFCISFTSAYFNGLLLKYLNASPQSHHLPQWEHTCFYTTNIASSQTVGISRTFNLF